MPLEIGGVCSAKNSTYMSLVILDILDQMKQAADEALLAQNKTVKVLINGDQEQRKQLEQLSKRLEAARLPQNMQQLKDVQAKIEAVLPRTPALGMTDVNLKLTSLMG